MQGAIESAL